MARSRGVESLSTIKLYLRRGVSDIKDRPVRKGEEENFYLRSQFFSLKNLQRKTRDILTKNLLNV